MSAREIALALGGRRAAQRLADGSYLVPCPVPSHGKGRGDRNPSLQIKDGASRVLVRCHAGCDVRDVLDELRRRGLLDDGAIRRDPPRPAERDNLENAERIWREAKHIEGTPGALYFSKRGIDITLLPDFGGLRWHPQCPWQGGPIGCVIARYTDALTAEPRGIWRRPIDGSKPKTLGPMRGCVIRLWPDEDVTTHLVLGEGVETVLSASMRFTHRNTMLRPAWAAGSAGNLESFPVLTGIDALTVLVDHDASSRELEAARACGKRWRDAGRDVLLLMPDALGSDFNDMVARP